MTVNELAQRLDDLIKAGAGERLVVVGIGDYVRSSASSVQLDQEHQVIIK